MRSAVEPEKYHLEKCKKKKNTVCDKIRLLFVFTSTVGTNNLDNFVNRALLFVSHWWWITHSL